MNGAQALVRTVVGGVVVGVDVRCANPTTTTTQVSSPAATTTEQLAGALAGPGTQLVDAVLHPSS